MTYFSRLFRYNKWLCFGISTFCVFTLAVNLLKVEITPFFVWGMYSEREKNVNEYEIFNMVVNDRVTIDYSSKFPDANRFYLLSPLAYSWQISQNGGIDPEESFLREKTGKYFALIDPFKKYLFNDSLHQAAFKKWYFDYLEGTIHTKVDKLEFNMLGLVYNSVGQPELQKKSTLAQWRKQ